MAFRVLKTTLSKLFKTEFLEVAQKPELYLRLTRECMEEAERRTRISTSPKFNYQQCKYLAEKLKMAVQSADLFLELINTGYSPSVSAEDMVWSLEIFKLLLLLGKEVESFIRDCCQDPWIQSAIMLTNVSEHVLSLGFNLKLCTIVFSNRKRFVALPTLEVSEVANVMETEDQIVREKASLDEARLIEDVSAMIQFSDSNSIDWQLATFLLERLESPRQPVSLDLLGSNESAYVEILEKGLIQSSQRLGGGAFGTVHKATWLGADVAKKTLHGPSVEEFLQEVSILEGLCHPNIVSLLWYLRNSRQCYIIMELMDGDLFSLIQERLQGRGIHDPPFSISEVVHIILQVAEGMLFLHEKRIVHRDLKSHNILVRRVKAKEMDVYYFHAKVADFGLSRTKEKSTTASIQTLNQGTTRWMAPEMIKIANDDGEIRLSECEARLKYPFKIDVYSFGMLCYEILSGKLPFSALGPSEVKKKVLAGDRPQLPKQYPERLRTLIKECWSADPTKRPSFHRICVELRHLECAQLMRSTWAKAPRCFSLDEIWRMTNTFSKDNVLSWGALTMVYKGVIADTGETVAVKRVFEKHFRCLDECKSQMEALSGLYHNNLVLYVGFCYTEEETILVFEYLPDHSLDKWLSEGALDLKMTWPVRQNICLGVANGIRYLHSLAQPRIIHRHIRPSNILLDQNLEPKIAGFQLALLSSDNESDFRSPRQGASTLGYLAPECATLGQLSEKVDVYSFGVVLLEVVSGRRNFDPKLSEDQRHLGEWARTLHSQGRVKELIDPALNLEEMEETEAVRTILVALLCMHPGVETRPEMTLVVAMLQGNRDEEISSLGLEHDNERLEMSIHDLPDLFESSSGEILGDTKEEVAAEEEGDSSDSNEGLDYTAILLSTEARIGLEYLSSRSSPKVRLGFDHLIGCASRPGGPLAVFNAQYDRAPPDSSAPPIFIKAIPAVIELAKDTQYSKLAMKLLVLLTSDKEVGPDSDIILEVADARDILISTMKEGSLNSTSLLAAETVANILVNKQVRKVLYGYDGIVPALVAFLNGDDTSQSIKHQRRADDICLKALQRLAKCAESSGDKTQMIVAALMKLLRRGLGYQPELKSLVRDSLVALENQLLTMDCATSTNEVCMVVWNDMSELIKTEGNFVSHTSVPGRMAIMNIMTKLCGLYKEGIDKSMFLYLLRMMKSTRSEISNLLEPSQEGIVAKQPKKHTELLVRSVRLLSFCVTHGKNTAQSVLHENLEERRTLQELLVYSEVTSGVFDESRLEILSILDQLGNQISQATVVKILVEMSKSKNQNCRQEVARKLRMLVEGKQHLTEFKEAGGISTLMALLDDPCLNCRQDAVVALQALPPSMAIPVTQLPLQTILELCSQKEHIDVTNAAVGLFALMVKEKAVSAQKFLETEGALEALLNLLDRNYDSHRSASALLEMAKEDENVRLRIAEPGLRGLDILVKYAMVHSHGGNKLKELLTATLVMFCRSGETCQEAVIKADGHMFLLTSLQETYSRDKAAQGLLELIKNTSTTGQVLEAGFVTTAMGSIARNFACIDIALGLACISSTQEGLNQIYLDSESVSALLILLEHCPDPSGKDAAALVIARLYPLLNRPEDVARRTTIAQECNLLLKHLDPLNIFHVKEFLQALAAIAAEKIGKRQIYEWRGLPLLINHLSITNIDIQGLVLRILSEMSSENEGDTRGAHRIRIACMEHKIADKLFNLFEFKEFTREFNRRTESMKDALILIRNLSLAGPSAYEVLVEQGAVTQLLSVLQRHENSLSIVTELAVKALEKLLDDKGKQVFLKGGGVKSLAGVLKLVAYDHGRLDDAKIFSTIILIAVAKDPHTRNVACKTIFDCDIFAALNEIIFCGVTSKIRWQAAVLLKLVAMYGPTKSVCSSMKAKGCLDALIHLRSIQHCTEMANGILKFVSEKSKDCKKYIVAQILIAG